MFTGEIIALVTVLCWTCSVQLIAVASREVGAIPVNIIRISIALLLFTVLLFLREGAVLPVGFPLRCWLLLALSGISGLFIGDIFLFKSLADLGPRITMLIQSLASPTAALFGWLFLSESYSPIQWLGMVITLIGVTSVVLEKQKGNSPAKRLQKKRVTWGGVVFAFLAMFGQAGGLLLSKAGMQTDTGYLDAFSATQIRVIAAFFCFVIFLSFTGKWKNVQSALNNTKAVSFTFISATVGLFFGISLSLLALQYLSTGVASTFFSLIPICILPFSIFLYKEHVSFRAILGAFVAVFGVYLLVS